MSENNTNVNKPAKTYVDGLWIREKKFDDGTSVMNISVLASKFGDFVKTHTKDDGFVNIILAPRREPDAKSTHYAYLDTWKPPGQAAAKPASKTPAKKAAPAPADNDDSSF